MPIITTGFYAAVLAVFYIALSLNVSATRGKTGVPYGDGGNALMLAAIRRQSNMAEHVPFALLLMALAELNGLGAVWVNIAGLILLAARVIHPFGIRENGGPLAARIVGASGTYIAMVIASVSLFLGWFG